MFHVTHSEHVRSNCLLTITSVFAILVAGQILAYERLKTMRYLLRETLEEIDLKLNAPDNPSCPRCGNYNALLDQYDSSLVEKNIQLLVCRDCGCQVEACPEPDIDQSARDFVENASDEAVRDALVHVHYVYGSSFSTAAEFNRMQNDVNYARETLFNTSYTKVLFSYFAGYVEGDAQGSNASWS